MDLKDFRDGLISLALVNALFSFTLIIGSLAIGELLRLTGAEISYTIIICLINIGFSFIYLRAGLKSEKIFRLKEIHIQRFAKRIGIINVGFSIHFFLIISMLFMGFNELQFMMIGLTVLMEFCLISLVYKEVYDLLLLPDYERKLELESNRKQYLDPDKKQIHVK